VVNLFRLGPAHGARQATAVAIASLGAILSLGAIVSAPSASAAPRCDVPNPPPVCDGGGGGETDPPPPPATPTVHGYRDAQHPWVQVQVYFSGGAQPTQVVVQQSVVTAGVPQWNPPVVTDLTGPLGTTIAATSTTYAVGPGQQQCYRATFVNAAGASPWWNGCTRQAPPVTDLRVPIPNGGALGAVNWIVHSSYDVTYRATVDIYRPDGLLARRDERSTSGDGIATGQRRSIDLSDLVLPAGWTLEVWVWSVDVDNASSWLDAPLIVPVHQTSQPPA